MCLYMLLNGRHPFVPETTFEHKLEETILLVTKERFFDPEPKLSKKAGNILSWVRTQLKTLTFEYHMEVLSLRHLFHSPKTNGRWTITNMMGFNN